MTDLSLINTIPVVELEDKLGSVFEHAPWVARGIAPMRPFLSIDDLHAAMLGQVLAAPESTRLEFLRGHPELAGEHARRSTLAAHSAER